MKTNPAHAAAHRSRGGASRRSLHVQQPTPSVAEVCATVRQGRRAGALALRLELVAGVWVCTAIAGLGPQDLPTQHDDEDDAGT